MTRDARCGLQHVIICLFVGFVVCSTYTVKYVLERNPSQASGWKIRSSSIVKSILDSDDIA